MATEKMQDLMDKIKQTLKEKIQKIDEEVDKAIILHDLVNTYRKLGYDDFDILKELLQISAEIPTNWMSFMDRKEI